eukprot:110969-Pelagomonas_calceolata.AAC.3
MVKAGGCWCWGMRRSLYHLGRLSYLPMVGVVRGGCMRGEGRVRALGNAAIAVSITWEGYPAC